MRSYLVVVPSPSFDHRGSFGAIAQPLHRETLIAEAAVETLIHPVLPRLSRIDERRVDALVLRPAQESLRHELGTVVAADVARSAMLADEAREDVDDTLRADASGDIDCEALACPLVDDREALDLAPVGA